jgi:starch synthase (maltosyl-transferring)
MNAIDKSGAAMARTEAGSRPRIFYADPLRVAAPQDVSSWLDEAVALGFDAVLIPPPWRPGSDGDRFAAASLIEFHPALGDGFLARFVAGCRARDLRPMMDVVLGHVADAFEGEAPGFEPQPPPTALDPRRLGSERVRHALPGTDLGAWWGQHISGWAAAGIAGFRLLGLAAFDAAGLVRALRTAAPSATLVAWTPGLAPAQLAGLQGVDFVVSSLPWWDMQAPWLWDELTRLRAIAPVLSCPEAPFEPRVAGMIHDPAAMAAALRRSAAVAAALGDGWIVTAGFANGARRPLDVRGQILAGGDQQVDINREITALNQMLQAPFDAATEQPLTGLAEPVLAVLRLDGADSRFASAAWLHLVNTDLLRAAALDPARLLAGVDGSFTPFTPVEEGTFKDVPALAPGRPVVLQPGEFRVYSAGRQPTTNDRALDPATVRPFATGARVAIEAPSPCIEDGSLAAKRLLGEVVTVAADIICDGHDQLAAVLRWRGPGETAWTETPMRLIDNDRWGADLALTQMGRYECDIQAWRDEFGSYRSGLAKKVEAGLDVSLELLEGAALVGRAAARAPADLRDVVEALNATDKPGQQAILLSPDLAAEMARADERTLAATLPQPLRIDAERSGAAFAAWYEVFPRSMSDDPARHGTFADVERHLPRIQAMGFDVLYFPPIHPIGRINRKGANNTLTPSETDPGSPYAIGAAEGGHEALHPELGSFDDFHHLIDAAAGHGLEIAIDFAIQCSPDHPWLREHRDWFEWRPDGSIRYAENPPKKYQDIVNVDFYAAGAIPDLWVALANSVLFWCRHGVRLFRVDNPHTKPFPFWRWMIAEVRARFPDAVFLAEAFTRPKVMYRLAKVGFSQSYTYFTWRETKAEMEAYLTELSEPGPRDFFRPHFFVNTPDINPVYLQGAPRSAYVIRAALAATLSGLWGVYNGFELCEGTPIPGREEYLDSEKYQIRAWDWDRPGNIVPEITALNRMRRLNPALRTHLNTVFLPAGNETVTVFEKATPDRGNVVVTAISFDPHQPQETSFEFPFWHWGATEQAAFDVENLVTGERTIWRGKAQSVRLTPDTPYVAWRIRPAS